MPVAISNLVGPVANVPVSVAVSNVVGPVTAVPVNTAPPVISGEPKVGSTVSASTGTWLNTPTSFAYQWKRNGGAIGGATSATYLLVTADLATDLTVTVTATNAAGSTAATSGVVAVTEATASHLAPLPPEVVVEVDFPDNPLAINSLYAYLAANPYSFYRLSEASGSVAADASGNGRNGALWGIQSNSFAGSYQVAGPITGEPADKALGFGTGSRVNMVGPAGADNGGDLSNGITFEAWFYFTARPGAGATWNMFEVASSGPSPYLTVDSIGVVALVNPDGEGGGPITTVANGVTNLNQWYHFAFTIDNETSVGVNQGGTVAEQPYLRLYRNGVEVASARTSTMIRRYTAAWMVGSQSGIAYLRSCRVDEAAVYNYALDRAEIAHHYAAAAIAKPAYPLTSWTALSNVKGASCQRGRGIEQQLAQPDAGEATATVADGVRALEPEYAGTSPGVERVVTASGNEITDALRLANVQGDGRAAPDASYGIWEAATNLIANGGFETNTGGWLTSGSGETIARDTALAKFGVASLKLTTNAVAGQARYASPTLTAGVAYTLSFWVRSSDARVIAYYFTNFSGFEGTFGTTFVEAGVWTRITLSWICTVTAAWTLTVDGGAGSGSYFHLDGVQLEASSAPNLISNTGFETDTSGWGEWVATGAISRVTAQFHSGAASLQQVAAGALSYIGVGTPANSVAGVSHTASVWVRVPTTGTYFLEVQDGPRNWTQSSQQYALVANTWKLVSVTFTPTNSSQIVFRLNKATGTFSGMTIFWDDAQVLTPIATPYVHTDGATASRSAARVQAPAGLLSVTQGWAAFRIRAGFASADTPLGDRRFAHWGAATGQLALYYNSATGRAGTYRSDSGSDSVDSSTAWARDDLLTVVFAWTATQLKISVNGAPFTTVASTHIPVTPAALIDLGSLAGSSQFLDSDVLWVATGTGTLTNADTALLVGLAESDKDRATVAQTLSAAAVPTAVWPASTVALNMDAPYPNVVPQRAVRALATLPGAAPVPLFSAFVERWQVDWQLRRAIVQLSCFDALAVFATWNVRGVRPQEPTGARIHAILDKVGWPTAARLIDTGQETVVAETWDGSRTALEELRSAADSELGMVFVDEVGNVVFHDRDHRSRDPRSTVSQALFSETPPGLPYVTVGVAEPDLQRVFNEVKVDHAAATTDVYGFAVDSASQAQNGQRALPDRSTRLATLTAAQAQAERIVARLKDPVLRLTQVTLEPERDETGTLWATVLGLRISDRVTVSRQPAGGGAAVTRAVYVEAISHNWPPGGRWSTTLTLSPV